MEIQSILSTLITDLTDPGGTLLLFPLLLPVIGLLLAPIVGGRFLGRVVLALMLAGLAVAVAIAAVLLAGGEALHYQLGGWRLHWAWRLRRTDSRP